MKEIDEIASQLDRLELRQRSEGAFAELSKKLSSARHNQTLEIKRINE